ncbi:hypothetical protein CesoFtcFv8_000249 [Champsocephalus esox]|uniref:Uncharacterized protein n=1 Tax=Champsocephalus esox TaxID=159716 RepID=A0AAN8DVG1_9TELE|nr:hypothetical protein CesoFtcFv8_000249 [Champsocephalus esox]
MHLGKRQPTVFVNCSGLNPETPQQCEKVLNAISVRVLLCSCRTRVLRLHPDCPQGQREDSCGPDPLP